MKQQITILCLLVVLLILIYQTNYDNFASVGDSSGGNGNSNNATAIIPITNIEWSPDKANTLRIEQNKEWKELKAPSIKPENLCIGNGETEICITSEELSKLKKMLSLSENIDDINNMLGDTPKSWPNNIGSKQFCLGKEADKECIDKDKLSNINTLLDSNSVKDNTEIYLQSFSNKGKWLRHERNNYAKFNTSSSELPTNSNMKFILRTV